MTVLKTLPLLTVVSASVLTAISLFYGLEGIAAGFAPEIALWTTLTIALLVLAAVFVVFSWLSLRRRVWQRVALFALLAIAAIYATRLVIFLYVLSTGGSSAVNYLFILVPGLTLTVTQAAFASTLGTVVQTASFYLTLVVGVIALFRARRPGYSDAVQDRTADAPTGPASPLSIASIVLSVVLAPLGAVLGHLGSLENATQASLLLFRASVVIGWTLTSVAVLLGATALLS